jgi:hypothetical protein
MLQLYSFSLLMKNALFFLYRNMRGKGVTSEFAARISSELM